MDIFHYHPATGAYLGIGTADPDPLDEGGWLIPAHATPLAPPAATQGHWPVFDPALATWILLQDHRGEIWFDPEGKPVTVYFLGDPLDHGLLQEPTTPPVDLTAYAAQQRWEKETGGTVWNGFPVHTDRDSQGKITSERLAIEASSRQDPDGWKFADGEFRMVSNADFVALSTAVRDHVRQCFAIEAQVLAGIQAGTINTVEEIAAAFA